MPVHLGAHQEALIQRDQYAKGGIGRFYWDYRDRLVFSHLNDADRCVADVGCGEGITTEKAAALFPGKRIYGVDHLLENLRICSAHRITAIGGDIYNLPFGSGSVDCVLLLEVVEHLENAPLALAEIVRVLKPCGRMILMVPNDRMFKIARLLTLRFREAFYDAGHVKQWTPESLRKLVVQGPFRIVRQRSVPFLLGCISLHHMVVCEKISA
jgi:ubiquinone/menaquinone biosynthesis C-methylase UbiE